MKSKFSKDDSLTQILSLCVKLDAVTCVRYRDFAKIANDENDKYFWLSMAEDEKKHVKFWQKSLKKSVKGELPQIFENSSELYNEIKDLIIRFKNYPHLENYDRQNAFEIALDMESHLFSPTFLFMLRFFSDDTAIIEDYHRHVEKFISEIKKSDLFQRLGTFIDNSAKLFRKNFELVKHATEDPLTKLQNRRGFYEKVIPILDFAARKNNYIGIIAIDIDNFKKINDEFGHQEGDKIIIKIAKTIKSSIRKYDLPARFGGEEFIIFTMCDDNKELRSFAERIRLKISENVKTPNKQPLTVSIGGKIAKVRRENLKFLNRLIADADKNLYIAKESGRNKTII